MGNGVLLTEATGVSVGLVIAALGLMSTMIGIAIVMWRWLIARFDHIEEQTAKERRALEVSIAEKIAAMQAAQNAENKAMERLISEKYDEVHTRISKIRDDFARFQVEAASRFVSSEHLTRTEDKLTAGLDKLIERFDAFAKEIHLFIGRAAKGIDI